MLQRWKGKLNFLPTASLNLIGFFFSGTLASGSSFSSVSALIASCSATCRREIPSSSRLLRVSAFRSSVSLVFSERPCCLCVWLLSLTFIMSLVDSWKLFSLVVVDCERPCCLCVVLLSLTFVVFLVDSWKLFSLVVVDWESDTCWGVWYSKLLVWNFATSLGMINWF